MKINKIQAAELVRYNANSAGKLSPDCVKRAISLAFDQPYTDIARMLNSKRKELNKTQWNIQSVYEEIIYELAGSNNCELTVIPKEDRLVLNDFVDNYVDSSYIYLVLTGRNRSKKDHIVCIRDGRIWDSWDSRGQWVIEYYTIKGFTSKQITNIKDDMEDLATYVVKDLVNNEIVKYMGKRKWNFGPIDIETTLHQYQIIVDASIMLRAIPEINKRRFYDFKIVLALSPTMTYDEAKEYILKAGKQKVYDKMWAINEEEKKLVEEEKMRSKLSEQGSADSQYSSYPFATDQERRFFNSLPGWIKPLVKYLRIRDPGYNCDSYTMDIKPHPDDPNHNSSDRIKFEAYQAWQLKDEIDRYLKNWETPFEDYYPADEY